MWCCLCWITCCTSRASKACTSIMPSHNGTRCADTHPLIHSSCWPAAPCIGTYLQLQMVVFVHWNARSHQRCAAEMVHQRAPCSGWLQLPNHWRMYREAATHSITHFLSFGLRLCFDVLNFQLVMCLTCLGVLIRPCCAVLCRAVGDARILPRQLAALVDELIQPLCLRQGAIVLH